MLKPFLALDMFPKTERPQLSINMLLWLKNCSTRIRRLNVRARLHGPACKIHVAHFEDLGKPAATPCPGNNDRVDETGHEECKGSIGGTFHTLCHCSAHDGSTRGAKRPLKEPTLDATEVDSQDKYNICPCQPYHPYSYAYAYAQQSPKLWASMDGVNMD